LRERALSLLLAWGSRAAWGTCEAQALDRERVFPFSMIAYAALGGPKEHRRLAASRDLRPHRIHVLRALGFSGNAGIVPLLFEHLSSHEAIEAKVAAQSISAIAGLDLRDDAFASSEPKPQHESSSQAEKDDLDADLVPPPEDDLPRPNAAAIRHWWASAESTLKEPTRLVRGQAFSPPALFDALEAGPLGLRHVWALTLAFRTRGRVWLITRALSGEQRKVLARLRSSIAQLAPNPFGSF
jgi:uncharacterized protein (TIGR02270 family)